MSGESVNYCSSVLRILLAVCPYILFLLPLLQTHKFINLLEIMKAFLVLV